MSWTDERVALLRKMWGEGKTAAEIAKELGGVTRNAVIGKAHRLKLSNRLSPIQQNTKKVVPKPAANEERKPAPRRVANDSKVYQWLNWADVHAAGRSATLKTMIFVFAATRL